MKNGMGSARRSCQHQFMMGMEYGHLMGCRLVRSAKGTGSLLPVPKKTILRKSWTRWEILSSTIPKCIPGSMAGSMYRFSIRVWREKRNRMRLGSGAETGGWRASWRICTNGGAGVRFHTTCTAGSDDPAGIPAASGAGDQSDHWDAVLITGRGIAPLCLSNGGQNETFKYRH